MSSKDAEVATEADQVDWPYAAHQQPVTWPTTPASWPTAAWTSSTAARQCRPTTASLRSIGKGRTPGGHRMCCASKIVEFYQSLMKHGESRQTGSRGLKVARGSKSTWSDLIGEITKNSHLLP